MSREEQFDFYWKEIFDGLAYNPIEFNVYRFDQSMSLPSKFNKLYEMFKQLALNNQEVMDYLKKFMETFDFKLETTIKDILIVWLNEGLLADVVREAINDEVIEARTDYLDYTYLNLKERLDLERKEIILARGESQTLGERLDSEKSEVNAQLSQTIKIGTEKFFTPEMQGSFYLLDRANPRDQVDKYLAMGFDGAVITLHIDGGATCTLREDMATVISVLEYAKEKGLKTNVCKFHATADRVDLRIPSVQNAYIARVQELLSTLSDYNIDTVYVLNEFGDLFKSQINFCLNTINTVKNLGYLVGVTHEYSDNYNLERIPIIDRMLTVPQLFEQSDVIGLNMYPTITNDWKNATRNDSVEAWSKVYPVMEQLRETFGKPLVFTEVGCYKYFQFLANPASWDTYILEPQDENEEATRIFWYGLLNDKRIQGLVDGVYSWFLDQMVESETIGFLKHYNERV